MKKRIWMSAGTFLISLGILLSCDRYELSAADQTAPGGHSPKDSSYYSFDGARTLLVGTAEQNVPENERYNLSEEEIEAQIAMQNALAQNTANTDAQKAQSPGLGLQGIRAKLAANPGYLYAAYGLLAVSCSGFAVVCALEHTVWIYEKNRRGGFRIAGLGVLRTHRRKQGGSPEIHVRKKMIEKSYTKEFCIRLLLLSKKAEKMQRVLICCQKRSREIPIQKNMYVRFRDQG